MFLNELKKDEGIAFIKLVKKLANIDETFSKEEKDLYIDYLKELNLKESDINDTKIEDVFTLLSGSNDRSKEIIYFELVGLALIDGEYEEKEVEFLEKVGNELNIARSKKIAFANYFYNFIDVYNFSVVDSDSKIELLKEQAEKLIAK